MADDFKDALIALIGPMRGYARALTRTSADADDLVQQTLLRAWRFRESYTHGTNLKAWVFTILRNSYYTEVQQSRRIVQDVDGAMAAQLAVDPRQQWRLEYEDLLQAIQELRPPLRDALVLNLSGDFSYEDLAEILECPVGTVKSRVNRARRKLADTLGYVRPARPEGEAPSAALG